VGVLVGVFVGVCVGVLVGVLVGTTGVYVGVLVAVRVGVGEFPPPPVCTINCGAFAPVSRLAKVLAAELVIVSPKLTSPFPVTKPVTSISTHVPPVNGPDDPATVPLMAGALLNVILPSLHVVFATLRTSTPIVELLLANSRSVAWVTLPVSPCTSKRR
jgi:hypothetical protein